MEKQIERLDTINKAIALMDYTFEMTSNKGRYPSKFIRLIYRMQDRCMDIYECLMDANRLSLETHRIDRIKLETKAIADCDKMSCYVEMSFRLHRIRSDIMESWQKRINDVKYMTIAWRTSDCKR